MHQSRFTWADLILLQKQRIRVLTIGVQTKFERSFEMSVKYSEKPDFSSRFLSET